MTFALKGSIERMRQAAAPLSGPTCLKCNSRHHRTEDCIYRTSFVAELPLSADGDYSRFMAHIDEAVARMR